MKKQLAVGLMALGLASPALAQEREERVIIMRGEPGLAPLPPTPPAPPLPPSDTLPPAAYGIPPRVVQKLGLPKEQVQKVQDLTFEANDKVITLEAEHKRAQLALERLLRSQNPSDSEVMRQVDEVGRAETAVRKNRIGLMLAIKRLLGPDTWAKLEAEMGDGVTSRRVRVERRVVSPDDDGAAPAAPPPPPARKP
ncbi:hypothetical protein P2318_14170 [Myxococcaceae bacterium GXIMD 01537]